MHIAVVGASGDLGRHLVRQALDDGHDVVALARRPEAVEANPGLEVVAAAAHDVAAMTTAFTGADAVIVAIGPKFRMGSRKPVDFMQRHLPLIIKAVKDSEAGRLVLVSAFGAGDTAAKASGFARFIYRTMTAPLFADKAASERSLPASGIAWTVVYPVNLNEGVPVPEVLVKDLDEVGSVPGLPTLPFTNAAIGILRAAADPNAEGRRLLITTQKGWRPPTR